MKRHFFFKDGSLFYDKDYKYRVPDSDPTYEVIRHIRIPPHLRDVRVVAQTLEQAQRSLVFVGVDSKNRTQYFYGRLHVQKRNENRDKIFVRVYGIINSIYKFIDSHLEGKGVKTQMAVFLLMETCFYIRTGKLRYLRDNDTVGLLTLKNKHISVEADTLHIRFVGKDKVAHEFLVHAGDRLFEPLVRLHNADEPEAFLFSGLSERIVYRCVRQFGVRVKDLRTYGVNVTFLRNLWNNVRTLPALPTTKKLIALSLSQTADAIGHSPGIARQAYMAMTVLELARDGTMFDVIRETTFEEFLEYIVKYVNNVHRSKWTEL
uniref:DNA topoisomerase n=1 Tax=Rousettus bat poxvirus TaxID=3141933 RepID=A0AAU7E226_9POXV